MRVSRIASRVRSTRASSVAGGGGVALVEDQVEHLHHGGHPAVAVGVGRRGEAGAGAGQLLLGAADPGAHGVLRRPVGMRDLGGRQAAHRAQRERHLGGGTQRRVAAQQQQGEAVVGLRGGARPAGRLPHGQLGHAGLLLAPAPGLVGRSRSTIRR